MIDFFTILLNLTIRLLPTGRAFRVPPGSIQEGVYRALAQSEADWAEDTMGILNQVLADNDGFTEYDATVWERRLAIRANETSSLDDRKLAINRKYASPGNVPARQHYLYLQGQLQMAGFDVYVHENRFDDGMGGLETRTPAELGFPSVGVTTFGDSFFGDTVFGESEVDKIAGFIDQSRDNTIAVPSDLRSTFYLSGETIPDFANVPEARREEFRQLVLSIKPLQTIGFVYVNYT